MRIEVLDPVWSRMKPVGEIEKVSPCLEYKSDYWAQGEKRKERTSVDRCMIHRGNGRFLTGFIPRIEEYCSRQGLKVDLCLAERLEAERSPSLPGIDPRFYQLNLFQSVVERQRGVIKSATGTGKTVIAGLICSAFPSAHIVFLCHTLDLLGQAVKAFREKFGFKNVIEMGGGQKNFDWPEEPAILVTTIQTFRKFDIIEHCEWADIIIVDECHHLTDEDSMIAQILKQSLALIRVGLSAELPKKERGRLVLEGFLGPVIGEFTYEQGRQAGVLSTPLFNLIPVPYNEVIGDISHYRNKKDFETGEITKGMYQRGIIENRARNRLALNTALDSVEAGMSALILTARDTQHGFILQELARDLFDLEIPFIYGDTEKEARSRFQDMLNKKDLMWAIANVVWKEGVDIPSLEHVINVGGEKYPTQIVGRGSRVTADKKFVKVTDFLDPYAFLSHHTVQRLIVYANEGWLDFYKIFQALKT